jgi:hypothetical protein
VRVERDIDAQFRARQLALKTEQQFGQFSILLASRARTRARAETKTRRVWRSAAAVSEMEFRNLQVM